MMSYRRHSAHQDFLSDPGDYDITAHVNFSYLKDVARQHGYEVEAHLSLREWLSQIWTEDQLAALWKQKDQRWRLQWKHLFAGMGETFQVLELRKHITRI